MSPDAPAPGFGPNAGTDSAGLMRRIDTTKAHTAPVYDVFLGGTDNFPADREAAAMALAADPRGHLDVRHHRDFVRRAVTELTTGAGVRQFLDVGAGQQGRGDIPEAGFSFVLRSRAGIERFLTENGLEQLEPGIVPAHHWRPDHAADAAEAPVPAPSAEHLAGIDAIERTRYVNIGEATDGDINVYVTVARKG